MEVFIFISHDRSSIIIKRCVVFLLDPRYHGNALNRSARVFRLRFDRVNNSLEGLED